MAGSIGPDYSLYRAMEEEWDKREGMMEPERVTKAFNFEPRAYFETEDVTREAPSVQFSS